jgi:hypothetical protein
MRKEATTGAAGAGAGAVADADFEAAGAGAPHFLAGAIPAEGNDPPPLIDVLLLTTPSAPTSAPDESIIPTSFPPAGFELRRILSENDQYEPLFSASHSCVNFPLILSWVNSGSSSSPFQCHPIGIFGAANLDILFPVYFGTQIKVEEEVEEEVETERDNISNHKEKQNEI